MDKLISIITPTFNSIQGLEKCILSVKNQSYKKIEHIIIDGGSTDGTVDIIKKYEKEYNVKWISEQDSGIADAMNKGFKMASGEIIAWLDADNYYDKDITNKVATVFETNPEVKIVYGRIKIIDRNNNTFDYKPKFPMSLKKALFYTTGAIPAQPGVFLKNETFKESGGFNTNYRIASDFDFWLKVLEKNPKIKFLNEVFGFYLLEDGGASQSPQGIYNGFKEMYGIGKKHGQPIYAKIFMFMKYLKCYMSKIFKIILKH